MDYSSQPLGSGPGGKMDSAQKEALMTQVKQQVAVANAKELLQKMTDKCFQKCIYKPGTSLASSDEKCLAMCMDRFMDTFTLVTKVYSQRLQNVAR